MHARISVRTTMLTGR